MSRIEGVLRRKMAWLVPVGAALLLSAAALAKSTSVTTHQTKRGTALAAANGHSLYLFTADKTGSSRCTGSCANTWLPLLTSSRAVAARGSGVNARLLGTIRRGNHALQVTYNGHPLYVFAGDNSPGQITGEGINQFGGHWYLVNTSGNAVKPRSRGGCPPGYVQTPSGCLPQSY